MTDFKIKKFFTLFSLRDNPFTTISLGFLNSRKHLKFSLLSTTLKIKQINFFEKNK